jgi:predicted RNA-binding Zn-ribbon protein involved in translation (DUF1610 family)
MKNKEPQMNETDYQHAARTGRCKICNSRVREVATGFHCPNCKETFLKPIALTSK